MKWLSNLDLNQNELQNIRIQNLGTNPSTPVGGQIYFNSGTNKLALYDSTQWVTYLMLNVADTISAQHTFNPSSVGAPFILGANAIGQLVTGLNADKLDGNDASAFALASHGTHVTWEATATNIKMDGTQSVGSLSTVARADHVHPIDTSRAASSHIHGNITNAGAIGSTSGLAVVTGASGVLTTGTIAVASGGTGATTAAGALTNLGLTVTAAELNVLDGITATTAELNYLDGVTSNIQTQLNAKLDKSGGTMTGYITLNADPISAMHPATKQYVDNLKQGLDPKDSCRVATTTNLAWTYNSGAKTLTSAVGVQTIDEVNNLALNDRVLVKNQTTGTQNGIYRVAQVGTASVAMVLERAIDFNISGEITSGAYTFVTEGTINAATGWVLSTSDPITLDTTALTFIQFSGAGAYLAGNGLTQSGNVFNAVGTANRITVNVDSIDIASTYVGQTSITTLGTIGTGTWNASTIAVNKGGTGKTSWTQYGLVYADTTTSLSQVSVVNSGVLVTSSSGVPSISTSLPSGIGIGKTPTTYALEVNGDVQATNFRGALIGNADTATKWASSKTITLGGDATGSVSIDGSANVTLTVAVVDDSHYHDGRYYTKAQADSMFPIINHMQSVATGGTNISSYTIGDILYASGTTVLSKLAKGTANQLLGMNSGATAPEYKTLNGTANNITVTHAANAITLNIGASVVTIDGAVSLTNKTLISPKISSINDIANNKLLIDFSYNANAVNYLTIANAVTGGSPTITASGTDANIGIILAPKGTGTVDVDSARITNVATPTVTTDAVNKAYVDNKKVCFNNTAGTSVDYAHNLNTVDVQVMVREINTSLPYAFIFTDIEIKDANTVTVRFATDPGADKYRIIVMG